MPSPSVDIDQLNVEERLRLIEQLWDSLAADPDSVPCTDAEKQELDRRLDEIDAGDDAGIPWQDVLERIQGRLK